MCGRIVGLGLLKPDRKIAHESTRKPKSNITGSAPKPAIEPAREIGGYPDSADAAVKGAERDPVFALERLIGVISARGRDLA